MRIALTLAVVLASCLVAVFAGPSFEGAQGDFVLWQLRVPRVLAGILVGNTLGLVGAAFQALFQNDLATPSTVGTTAGATLGALVALVFGGMVGTSILPLATLFAFLGAALASLAVALVAVRGYARMGDVLLAGIAVTLASSALSQGVQSVADMRALFAATQWALGQLPQLGYGGIRFLAPIVVASTLLVLSQVRPLQVLSLGEELAHAQGVHVRRVRLIVLLGGALGVAGSVAWCGPIAFVGLIVPHIVRLTTGPELRTLLPLSGVVGAGFLVACDTLARVIWSERELPVGVLTATLGAPALFMLVLRRR
ncbi:MAG TPA: iron ABC transporter permease [Polyangiaceae bacterium]